MLRDDDDVRKLLTVITSGLMTDPFSLDEDDDEISPLIKIATDVRMPFPLTERLVSSLRLALLGQITRFVEQRLITNNATFWDSLPNLKIRTFASLVKKKTMKLVYGIKLSLLMLTVNYLATRDRSQITSHQSENVLG